MLLRGYKPVAVCVGRREDVVERLTARVCVCVCFYKAPQTPYIAPALSVVHAHALECPRQHGFYGFYDVQPGSIQPPQPVDCNSCLVLSLCVFDPPGPTYYPSSGANCKRSRSVDRVNLICSPGTPSSSNSSASDNSFKTVTSSYVA